MAFLLISVGDNFETVIEIRSRMKKNSDVEKRELALPGVEMRSVAANAIAKKPISTGN